MTLRRSVGGLLVALLLALGLVVVGPATAYACSCVEATPRQLVRGADVVVDAEIVRTSPERVRGGLSVVHTLEVREVFKGDATTTVRFSTANQGSACGIEAIEGRTEGVFLLARTPSGPPPLAGSSCGGSLWLTSEEVEQVTGPGRPPSDAEPAASPAAAPIEDIDPVHVPGEGDPVWPLYVGGAALLAVAAGAVLWWRRRSA